MAKWINRDTNETGTFDAEKEEIKTTSPIRIYGSLQRRKMRCLFLFFLIKASPELDID